MLPITRSWSSTAIQKKPPPVKIAFPDAEEVFVDAWDPSKRILGQQNHENQIVPITFFIRLYDHGAAPSVLRYLSLSFVYSQLSIKKQIIWPFFLTREFSCGNWSEAALNRPAVLIHENYVFWKKYKIALDNLRKRWYYTMRVVNTTKWKRAFSSVGQSLRLITG